jgi:hypothetical protein
MMTGPSTKPESGTGRTSARVHHPRHLRPGSQPGEVRVRRLGAGSPGPPHLCRRHRSPPGQHNFQVILFWQLLISTMCVYFRHTVWQKYLVVGVLKYFAVSQN